jgi:dihydropyrimidinase
MATAAADHPPPGLDEADVEYILIRNATVVNADHSRLADVLVDVKAGTIVDVAPKTSVSPDTASIKIPPNGRVRVVDGAGQYLLPGGIDPHVHLALTFMGQVSEPPLSGTRCAIAGGTTLIMDFIIPPVTARRGVLLETYRQWMDKYGEGGPPSCHYAFHGCITKWDDETMPAQLEELRDVGGINSFKMFMAYKDALMLDDASLLRGFAHCKRLGLLPAVHAENGELVAYLQDDLVRVRGVVGPEGHPQSRPDRVESEACERAITIASQLDAPLMIVHNTTEGSVRAIQRGQHDGVRVLGEATIAHLMLDESRYYATVVAGDGNGGDAEADRSTWDYRAAHVL